MNGRLLEFRNILKSTYLKNEEIFKILEEMSNIANKK